MQNHPLTREYLKAILTVSPEKKPIQISDVKQKETSITNAFKHGQLTGLRDQFKSFSLQYPCRTADYIGLNTLGMLADRLSILCIKFYMTHEGKIEPEKFIDDCQILDIEKALGAVKNGTSSSYNKLTNNDSEVQINSFENAVMSLGSVNLLLWLAQDVLYLRGPSTLPDQELRSYITYFAEKNILRNKLIYASNRLYWK